MTTVSELRAKVFALHKSNDCSENVLRVLFDGKNLIEQEDYLWDYKVSIGTGAAKAGSKSYQAKICEIAKDIAAFHNTLGGYLIFGIEDKTARIVGCTESFPVDDLSTTLSSHLKKKIDFTVRRVDFQGVQVTLVHVPRRGASEQPKAFAKPAKISESGKQAYKQDDIYYRDGIGSSPARGDALAALIAGRFEIPGLPSEFSIVALTENNLPSRNYEKRDFIGRQAYLDVLWRWLLDPFTPVKLVTGIGGLGKTTLVRQFVEDVIERPPEGFQSLIWFSAKSRHFDAETARFLTTDQDDPNFFSNPNELYGLLLSKLGVPDEELTTLHDDQDLLERLTEALTLFPALVVIDDLDSLSSEEQAQVFQELGMVFSRTAALSSHPSRCIFTARELVGAAPRQTIKLQGFEESEFFEHIEALFKRFNGPMNLQRKQALFKKFFKESGGSPLFAAAIVRLVHNGYALDQALQRFRGKDGSDVRSFAFEREIDRLAQGQLRCLYALIKIAPCSRAELLDALEVSEDQLLQEMSQLRDFHLVETFDKSSAGGLEYELESYIKLLGDLVQQKIADPRRIERRCKDIRSGKKTRRDDVAKIISQAVSLWRIDDFQGALDFLLSQKQLRSSDSFTADLKCMLGRAYLRVDESKWKEAEKWFREAYAEGCQRPELFELWIETLEIGQDWVGVADVSKTAINDTARSKYYLTYGNATIEQAGSLSRGGNDQAAIDLLTSGGEKLNEAFRKRHAHTDTSADISSLRNQCYRFAVTLGSRVYRANSEKIYLWEISWRAFENYARTQNILEPGISAVNDWADYKSKYADNPTRGDRAKLGETIGRLGEILAVFYEKNWAHQDLVSKTEAARDYVKLVRKKVSERLAEH